MPRTPDYSYAVVASATDETEITLPRGLINALCELALTTDGITKRELQPHQEDLVDFVRMKADLKQADEDRAWLHAYLYFNGAKKDDLHPDIHVEAMTLCNGYGQFTEDELREREMTWDWSHVRDSSPEALAECRAFIEGILSWKP